MTLHRNLIAGDWVEGTNASDNINPSNTGDVVGQFAQADAAARDEGGDDDDGGGRGAVHGSCPRPASREGRGHDAPSPNERSTLRRPVADPVAR